MKLISCLACGRGERNRKCDILQQRDREGLDAACRAGARGRAHPGANPRPVHAGRVVRRMLDFVGERAAGRSAQHDEHRNGKHEADRSKEFGHHPSPTEQLSQHIDFRASLSIALRSDPVQGFLGPAAHAGIPIVLH